MSDSHKQQRRREKLLYRSRTHWKALLKMIAIQVGLLVAHVVLLVAMPSGVDYRVNLALHGAIILLEIHYVVWPVLKYYNEFFELTDRRLINRWGVINKESREIPLSRIVSINEERDLIDRIFGCGTLIFYSSAGAGEGGQDGPGVAFRDIPNVRHFRELIEEAKWEAQRR